MRRAALGVALLAALPAAAVTLDTDGLGQALIYPYYTAQSIGNDAFNTYISVVNHANDAKALRVRFRESRLGKAVLDLNLYLSPNDVWTGVLTPTLSGGTTLLTVDKSCAEPAPGGDGPPFPGFYSFANNFFSGTNLDGAGAGLDRTREGFVEIIEMATLTGASATAVTHNSAGVPPNCAAILSGTPSVAAPTGGLSGTLTLINVATGMDFTVNATALDALAQRPFFRRATDPYPDFNAAEIDAVSIVSAQGATWRSVWDKPVDAVSATLMRTAASGEYVLDTATASLTDFVLTFPTRHFYVNASTATAPFTAPDAWTPNCASRPEALSIMFANREEQLGASGGNDFGVLPPQDGQLGACASAAVASFRNAALAQMSNLPATSTAVLGSQSQGLNGGGGGRINVNASDRFQSGWAAVTPQTQAVLASGALSVRVDHATGQSTAGAQRFAGLPMLGFSARIFRNGTLRCDAGACQGNYGGAFPFTYRRNISPAS